MKTFENMMGMFPAGLKYNSGVPRVSPLPYSIDEKVSNAL
jgi:hypothetical protein